MTLCTKAEETYSSIWPMTKENTWYGYKDGEIYIWYRTKKAAIRNIPNKKGWIHRATLIKRTMYINHSYAKMGGW